MVLSELVTYFGFEVEDKALKKLNEAIGEVRNGILGLGIELSSAAAGLFFLVERTAKAGFNAELLAQQTGMSTKEFQRLAFAAKLTGVESEEFAHSVALLNRRMQEGAQTGSPQLIRAFQKVGISFGELKTLSPEMALKRIADRLKAMPEGAQRGALAMETFGRGGARLLPFLIKGSESMKELGAEGENLGYVLSDADVAASKVFKTSMHFAEAFFIGLKNQIGTGLMPAMNDLLKKFNEFLMTNKEILKTNIQGFVKGVADVLKRFLIPMAVAVSASIMRIVAAFGGAEKATKLFLYTMAGLSVLSIVFGIGRLIQAFFSLGVAMDIAKFKALAFQVAAFALPIALGLLAIAIGLIAEDIYTYFHGGKSVFGIIADDFDGMIARIESKFPKLKSIFEYLKSAKEWFWGDKELQAIYSGSSSVGRGGKPPTGPSPLQRAIFGSYPTAGLGGKSSPSSGPIEINPSVTINMLPSSSAAHVAGKVQGGIERGVSNALREAGRHTQNPAKN